MNFPLKMRENFWTERKLLNGQDSMMLSHSKKDRNQLIPNTNVHYRDKRSVGASMALPPKQEGTENLETMMTSSFP